MDARPSRLMLAVLNPLNVKLASIEVVDLRRRKKKRNRVLKNIGDIFSSANCELLSLKQGFKQRENFWHVA